MSAGAVFKLIANDGKADRMIMATELLNQRIKDKLVSLKVHVKACASVCERDTLVCSIYKSQFLLYDEKKNKRDVFKLREVPKAFDTTMRPRGTHRNPRETW